MTTTQQQQQQNEEEEEEDYDNKDEEHEPYFNPHEKPLLRRLPKRLRHKMLPCFDPTATKKYPFQACDNDNPEARFSFSLVPGKIYFQSFQICIALFFCNFRRVGGRCGRVVFGVQGWLAVSRGCCLGTSVIIDNTLLEGLVEPLGH